MYVNREPRFYATVTYSGSDWINTTSSLGVREIQLYYTGESGKGGSHDYSGNRLFIPEKCIANLSPNPKCSGQTACYDALCGNSIELYRSFK